MKARQSAPATHTTYRLPSNFHTEATTQPTPSQRRAINRGAKVAKAEVRLKRQVSREANFPANPVQGMRRSEQRAVQALSELRASNPREYERRLHPHHLVSLHTLQEGAHEFSKALSGAAKAANFGVSPGKVVSHDVKAGQRAATSVGREIGHINRGLASAPLSGHATKAERAVRAGGPVQTNISKDALDFVANIPTSTYITGAAAVEAAKGNTKPLKHLVKDFKKHDAFALAAQGKFKQAAKVAQRHPVTTAAEASGVEALAGRAGGAFARHAPIPGKTLRAKVRAAGSTERPNLRLYPGAKPGEGPEIEQKYSKDIIRKGAQKLGEKVDRMAGRDPNVDYGKPDFHGGRNYNRLNRRVDTRVHSQERASQGRRVRAEHAVSKIIRRRAVGKHGAAGVQLVAESTARIGKLRQDFRKRLGVLARERQKLTDPERIRLNRDEAKHIRHILAMNDEQLQRFVHGAGQFVEQQKDVQARGIQAGAFTHVGRSKRFYPHLQSHVSRPAAVERPRAFVNAPKPPRKAPKGVEARDTAARAPGALSGSALKAELQRHQATRRYSASERAIIQKKLQQRFQKGKSLPAGAEALAEAKSGLAPGVKPPRAKVGQPKLVTRADFEEFTKGLSRQARLRARRPLTPDELANAARTAERHTRRHGESPFKGQADRQGPAIITQRPGRLRFGARLKGAAPFEPTKARSGKAFQQGAREVGAAALRRHAISTEAEVTAAQGHQLLDREFGIPAGHGGRRYADSRDKALAVSRRIAADNPETPPLVPVNIAQFQTFGARLLAKQEQGIPRPNVEVAAAKEMWHDALHESGRGKWVLMPENVVERLQEHASVGNFGPLRAINNTFKDVVLTSSSPFRWMGANVADLTMRTVLAGIKPTDVIRGMKITRAAQQKGLQGEQAVAATAGGGLYHTSAAINRAMRPHGAEEHIARTIASTPWRVWKGGVYMLEQALEELPQKGAIGKEAKADMEMKAGLKGLLKLHDEQIDHFANRLATDRALEARIQKATEDVVGRWGKVSPNMRRALLISPFAQWLGAAMRYTFVTLPAHHPIKTAMLAALSNMTESERQALGFSYFLPREKQIQDYEMGALPTNVGRNKYGPTVKGIRTKTMLSFGTAADFPGNLQNFVLPQFSGPLNAWQGINFTGDKLVYPDWWPEVEKRRLEIPPDERNKIGLGMLMESTIPFASAFRRVVEEKGRSAEPTSTIITPQVRKKWDNENKRYIENKGEAFGGILGWLTPFPRRSQDYTYGAVKSIQESGIAGDVLDKWRKQAKHTKNTDPLAGLNSGAASSPTPAPKGSKNTDPLAGF